MPALDSARDELMLMAALLLVAVAGAKCILYRTNPVVPFSDLLCEPWLTWN